MVPVFYGKVENFKLLLDDNKGFQVYLLTLDGKAVQVVVGRVKKQRSSNENRYYWGVIVKLLSDHTGYSSDEMHDALRMLFLLDRDKKIPTLKSTAFLTTVEFESYMSEIRMWASKELSVYIPEPNEVET